MEVKLLKKEFCQVWFACETLEAVGRYQQAIGA